MKTFFVATVFPYVLSFFAVRTNPTESVSVPQIKEKAFNYQ